MVRHGVLCNQLVFWQHHVLLKVGTLDPLLSGSMSEIQDRAQGWTGFEGQQDSIHFPFKLTKVRLHGTYAKVGAEGRCLHSWMLQHTVLSLHGNVRFSLIFPLT